MGRERLPDRRRQISTEIAWGEGALSQTWTLSVGLDDERNVKEIFVTSILGGSDMEALVDDACVAISLLLQHGMDIAEVAKHLGREGVNPDAPAASILGVAVARAAELQTEEKRRKWPSTD